MVTKKYKHALTAFVEALNKLLAKELFKVQDAQEFNDPKKVSLTWVKHLYGLVDKLNDTETQMIAMSPKDAIRLREVNYPQKIHCLKMDCIITYNGLVKNMTTNVKEQWIGYRLRNLTD